MLDKLYLALKPFFDLDHPVLPAAYIRAVLQVARKEGLGRLRATACGARV
jgi:hypothetical protein